jgi:hypothetical protein
MYGLYFQFFSNILILISISSLQILFLSLNLIIQGFTYCSRVGSAVTLSWKIFTVYKFYGFINFVLSILLSQICSMHGKVLYCDRENDRSQDFSGFTRFQIPPTRIRKSDFWNVACLSIHLGKCPSPLPEQLDGCYSYLVCKGEVTPRKLATATSENCYQPELNTCYWMEQRKLRKQQRNSRKNWETQFPGNGACQSSHSCVAAWFPSVSCSMVRQWFICYLRWHERLTKLLILFLCS